MLANFFINCLLSGVVTAAVTVQNANAPNKIPGSYIVTFKPETLTSLIEQHKDQINSYLKSIGQKGITDTYSIDNFKGYSVKANDAGLDLIAKFPFVAKIFQDLKVTASTPTPQGQGAAACTPPTASQSTSAWQLRRMSHKVNPLVNNAQTYDFDKTSCAGTTAYVIDTGIYTQHPEFGGRATFGANFISGSPNTDENGHGTHVAGSIGSTSFGVCKNITLVAVKVLDAKGNGALSGVISGAQWAVSDAQKKARTFTSVLNLSLGGDFSAAGNDAFTTIVNRGFTVVVAAGNAGAPANLYTPSSADKVIAVGATDINDQFAYFSNYGPEVKISAPGVDIRSTWPAPLYYNVISGTSMSTPHIAGLAAYYMSMGVYAPANILAKLQTTGLKNVITSIKGATPNILSYNFAEC